MSHEDRKQITEKVPLVAAEGSLQDILNKDSSGTFDNTTDSLEAAAEVLAKIPKSDGTVSFNATALGAIQAEAEDAIEADNLDQLVKVALGTDMDTDVHDNSVVGEICAKSVLSTWDRTTDSLEALSEAINAITSSQQVTVTEQEAMVAGDICISTSGGFIPESSLTDIIATQVGADTALQVADADDHFSVDWLDDSTFIIAFKDASATNFGALTPVVLGPDRVTATVGPNYVYNSVNLTGNSAVTSVGNGRFVVSYDDSVALKCQARAGQWTAPNGITFGAEVDSGLDTSSSRSSNTIVDHDDDAFAWIFNDNTNSLGKMFAGTVNSSTLAITLGSAVQIGTGDNTEFSICKVDTNKVCVAFKESGDSKGYAEVCTIVTVTITEGTAVEFEAGATTYTDIDALDTANVVIVSVDGGDSSKLKAIIGEISGTTISFGGSAATLSEGADSVSSTSVVATDSTHFMAIWDNSTDSKTVYSISTVSGTTITAGNRTTLLTDIPAASTTHQDCLSINGINDIVYLGKSTNVYAVLFDVLWQDDTYDVYDITGVASDAVGTIIVDGIDEGNASGLDKQLTTFMDCRNYGIRKKDHSCTIPGYIARVRNLDTDALKAIGG